MVTEPTTTAVVPLEASPPAAASRAVSSLALLGSATTFLLLIVGIVGIIFHNEPLRATGTFGVFSLGPGSAVLSFAPTDNRSDEPLLLMTSGLAIGIAISFLMIESRFWHPDSAFAVLAALITLIDGYGIWKALSGGRRREATHRSLGEAAVGVLTRWTRPLRHPSILLTGLGTGVWIATAVSAGHIDPGVGGFLTSISLGWYVGLVLVVVGIISAPRSASTAVAIGTLSLVLALTVTPAIVYGEPRSTSAAEHVGVTLLLMARHRVDPSIDIYNAWPGFFSAMAWVCDVAGIHDPMSVARWWPVLMGVLEIVCLQSLASKFLGNGYRPWIAVLFAYLVNTVGQDYYSPQSVAFILALVVYSAAISVEQETRRSYRCRVTTVVFACVVIAATHQLTPYIVALVLVVLVCSGHARPKLIPLAALIPAGAWAADHWHIVKSYINFRQVGSLSNYAPPKTGVGDGLHRMTIVGLSSSVLVVGGIILCLLGLWALVSQQSRLQVTLGCCCVASVILGLASPYGNEAIFRGVLFASPWLGVMAASATLAKYRAGWVLPGAIPLMVATFAIASFGLDASRIIRPGDLTVIRAFEEEAQTGSVLLAVGTGDLPVQPTARYPDLSETGRTASSMWQGPPSTYRPKTDLLDVTIELRREYPYAPQYWAIWSPTQLYYEEEYGIATASEADALKRTMSRSSYWSPVLQAGGSVLYRLTVSRIPRS